MSKIIQSIGDKIIIPSHKLWMGLEDRFPARILYPRLSKKSILMPGNPSPSASPSSGPVTYDSFASYGSKDYTNPKTFNITVGTNNNRLLLIEIMCDKRNTPTAITYDGSADGISLVDSQSHTSEYSKVYIYKLVNPASGTKQVSITLDGSLDTWTCGATAYSDVNGITPIGSTQKAEGSASPAAVTVSDADANDMPYFAMCVGTATGVGTASHTSIWALNGRAGVQRANVGTNPASFTWTLTGTIEWVAIGFSIQAV